MISTWADVFSVISVSETRAYLLASSNLTPWHLLKSHPVSPANSSRVTYPLRGFMTYDFLWDHSGPFSPERSDGSTAAVRMNGSFPSRGTMKRIQFLRAVSGETEQILKSVSNHSLLALLHVPNTTWVTMSPFCATDPHRRPSRTSLKGIWKR